MTNVEDATKSFRATSRAAATTTKQRDTSHHAGVRAEGEDPDPATFVNRVVVRGDA
jgi:hypothetical protein